MRGERRPSQGERRGNRWQWQQSNGIRHLPEWREILLPRGPTCSPCASSSAPAPTAEVRLSQDPHTGQIRGPDPTARPGRGTRLDDEGYFDCATPSGTPAGRVRAREHPRMTFFRPSRPQSVTRAVATPKSSYLMPLALTAAALAAAAVANHALARRAERNNPPSGRMIEVDGVRLHYLERGKGVPLVLLHGNGSMIQDFVSSGLFDRAARDYRVIAFDRPGYGHSERPRGTIWTAAAQADLLNDALARIGVDNAIVLGHSWGCSVAVALARRHPTRVRGLVLASGYHYPTVRLDVVALSVPAIPIIGDVIRYTVSPLVSRILWPLLTRRLFAPAPVPEKFKAFPREMALRPSQIRASAAEAAIMVPQARAASSDYAKLNIPVAVIAGAGDRLVDPEAQSARLHDEIRDSSWHCVEGAGHMIHHSSLDATMSAIERVSSHATPPRSQGKDKQAPAVAANS